MAMEIRLEQNEYLLYTRILILYALHELKHDEIFLSAYAYKTKYYFYLNEFNKRLGLEGKKKDRVAYEEYNYALDKTKVSCIIKDKSRTFRAFEYFEENYIDDNDFKLGTVLVKIKNKIKE